MWYIMLSQWLSMTQMTPMWRLRRRASALLQNKVWDLGG